MKLGYISELIVESTKFPVWDFIYPPFNTDPTPKSLVLGFYEHPRTGNQLMAGVNVRLLNASSAQRLLEVLDQLGDGQNTIKRVRILRHLLGSVFDTAYRTYDVGKMKNVRKGTISGTEVDNLPDIGNQDVPQTIKVDKPKVKSTKVKNAKVKKPQRVDPKPRPQEVPPETKRGERRLEKVPKRPEGEVQRPDSDVPGVADEEY